MRDNTDSRTFPLFQGVEGIEVTELFGDQSALMSGNDAARSLSRATPPTARGRSRASLMPSRTAARTVKYSKPKKIAAPITADASWNNTSRVSSTSNVLSPVENPIALSPVGNESLHVPFLPFGGPFVPRGGLTAEQVAGGWEGAWYVDDAAYGSLDAPEWLPAGGHAALEIGKGYRHHAVLADGYASGRGYI